MNYVLCSMGFTRRGRVLLVGLVGLLFCLSPPLVEGVRLPMFIPFGPDQGDEALERGNDDSAVVDLQQIIPFLGVDRGQIIVDTDGVLELREDQSAATSAFVYAFSADVDTTGIGEVFYRETTNVDVLDTVSELVNFAFPSVTMLPISVTSAFVATWFYVGYFDNHVDRTNTLQCVVATDGVYSFVILLYADDLIEWMTGDADGGVGGLGGDRADVGIIGDDPMNAYFLPASNTSAVLMLDSTSNIGMGGVWMFRVNDIGIILPEVDECAADLDNCDPNADCIDLMEGFACECSIGFTGDGERCTMVASGSGSASGDMPTLGSCIDAGFTNCCVIDCNIANDTLGSTCFCDQACFFFGDCCLDILDVPCFPDIQVQFVLPSHTVIENEGTVTLPISITGSFPSPPLPPLEAFILLYSQDQTAEEPFDYDGTVQILEFSSSGMQFASISIVNDTLVENTESFKVNITTTDDFVTIVSAGATTEVFIIDDDSVNVAFELQNYIAVEVQGTVEVCVTLVPPASISQLERNVSVNISTADGTATSSAPADYVSFSEMLVFSSDPVECVEIQLISDGLLEFTEEFFVSLSSSDPGVIIDSCCATVSILDNDAVHIGFTQTSYTIDEGQLVTVCVELFNGTLEIDLMATIQAVPDSASPADFASGLYPIVITPANQPGPVCVNITTVDDNIHEGLSERFLLFLVAPSPQVFIDPSSGVVVINDNDVIDLTIVEEIYNVDEGVGFVEVCVELSGERERTVMVDLFTDAGGNALEPDDFISFSEALAFSPGPAQILCRNITIIDDTAVEEVETFFVFIDCGSCDNINVVRNSADINIIDNDMVVVQFVTAFGITTEGSGPTSICLELIGTIERPVEVLVSTSSSSAVSPNDFVAVVNGPVIFLPPASTPVCINVGIVDDSVIENTETFIVQIVGADLAVVVGSPSMSEISIRDNDAPVVEFVLGSYNTQENVSPLSVCLTLNGAVLERSVTVTISTSPGTAVAMSDYIELSSSQVFFPATPGVPSPEQCADIVIVNDDIPEDTETFTVAIDNPQSDPTLPPIPGVLSSAIVTIIDDDDDADCTISFVQPTYLVDEDVTNGDIAVCLRLDGITTVDVTVDFSTVSTPGTATPVVDYVPVSTIVTFTPTAPANFAFLCPTVDIEDDAEVEMDEFFTVSIGNSECSISQSTAVVTILDDERDEPVIEFQLPEYFVDEDDLLVTVCVEVIPVPEPGQTIEATYTTVNGAALAGEDYVLTSGTVSFTSMDSPIFCFDVPIIDDTVPELTESFNIELTQTLSTGVIVTLVPVTINDDDPESLIDFQFATYNVDENEMQVEICAIVSPPPAAGQSVTASYATADGDAIAGMDYLVTMGQFTFTSTTPQMMCFTVPIIDDAVEELTETFSVQLTQVVLAGVISQTASVVITDDDQVASLISFEMATYNVGEGSLTVEVCAVASPPPAIGQTVTASYFTSDGTAVAGDDYVTTTGQFTFMSLTPQPQCTVIPIIDDLIFEPTESFSITLQQTVTAGVIAQTAVVSISDNDEVESLINFEMAVYNVNEQDLTVEVCAVASPPPAVGQTVTASYSTSDGTALVDEDYEAVAGQFSFTASTPQPQCIDIPIVDNFVFELTETFNVVLLQTVTAGVISQTAVVSISDNDEVESLINFEMAVYNVNEQDLTVEVCAVASPPPAIGQTVTASYSTSDGTALVDEDYEAVAGQFSFTASTPQPQCIDIPIVDNFVFELTETFNVVLLQTVTAGVISQTAVVNIFDNDGAEPIILFQFPQYDVFENEMQVEICAVVSPNPSVGQTVSASYETSDGTALVGQDYVFESGMFTFTSTTTEPQCFMAMIIDDGIFESTETFSVTLTQQLSESVEFDSTLVTIFDDDQPVGDCEIGFISSTYLADEDIPLSICIRLDGPTNMDVTFMFEAFSAPGDTATPSVDYEPRSTVLTFFPVTGFTFLCPSVEIFNDAVPEPDETFTVRISNSVCTIAEETATVIIEDDDGDEPLISFQFPDFNFNEDDPSVQICAVVAPPPSAGQSVSATYSTSSGTALAGFDYVDTSGMLTFTSTTSAVQCFFVTILDDLVPEPSEIFTVTLTQTLSNGVREVSAPVTILDNDPVDDIFITFETLSTFIEESGVVVELCAVTSSTPPVGQTVSATFTTQDGSAFAGFDYTFNSGTLSFTAITPQRQCSNVFITNNEIEEPNETFDLVLTQTVSSGVLQQVATITILDDDLAVVAFEQPGGYFVLETSPSIEACLVVDVSTIDSPFTFSVSILTNDVDATAGIDYVATSDILFFSNGATRQCIEVPILPDFLGEANEDFLITFSRTGTPTQGTFVGMTSVTIIHDFPFDDEPIVLINNTPDVELEAGALTASVEVDFTLRNDVDTATCELSDLIGPRDCSDGFIIFTGLPADRQPPLVLIITARNAQGEVLANITRQVRLGFNFDCSVNFVNAAEEIVAFFQGFIIQLEWEEIGPVEFTECRLDQEEITGIFVPCTTPFFITDLPPGEYSVKVRPNGEFCDRRIRRTVFFSVI